MIRRPRVCEGAVVAAALIGAALVLSLPSPFAPEPSARRPVRVALAHRQVEAAGFPSAESTNQTATVRGTRPYVLMTAGSVDKALRLAAEAAGARVIGPYPPQAFLVEADAAALRRLAKDARFAGATEFLPADKVDPRLQEMLEGGAVTVDASVLALAPDDRARLEEIVVRGGGERLKGCLRGKDSFRARLPAALVGELARCGEVRWLEAFRRPKLLNDLAVEPAAMNVREVWDTHGLTGKGQVVSTSDSGIDTGDVETMHRDLADRIAGIGVVDGCNARDENGHGTHTAGSIVGNGTMSDGAIRGVAHGAKLWAWFCEGEDDLYMPWDLDDLFRPERTVEPKYIHSASWGTPGPGTYDSYCAEIDEYAWNHPDFLPVFSAGNEGSARQTIGSPAAAKNVLSVGATQNVRTGRYLGYSSGDPSKTADYSSRGPCQDGRVKPDVSAPGSGILSTRAYACGYGAGIGVNTNYAYNCGTSMAAPLTAGAMALVREWLVDRRGFTNAPPSAALMKAVITGGAKGRETPDDDQGWGRVDLEETLYPSNRAVRLIDRLPFASGERFTYEIETTNAAPLDVQLAWVDAPGTAGYDQQSARLVNDLDLTVRAVVGDAETAWCGNGGSEPDHLNTLESVRIGFAPAATYRIDVTCKQIVYDHAEGGAAALYIRGAFDPQATEPDLVVLKVMADFPEGVSYGMSPEVGMWSYPRGSRVTLTAGESYGTNAYGTAVAYHACEGFKGSGSVPASGSEATLEVVLDEDSAVDWRVAKVPQSYLLSFGTCNFPESCNPFWDEWYLSYYNFEYTESYWIETNEEVSVSIPMDLPYGNAYSAYAYSYHLIWGWQRSGGPFVMKLGEVGIGPADEKDELQYDGKNRLPRSLDFRMDGPKDIWAYYYDESSMIDEKLPAWWYARFLYGSFANGLIDEAASLKDGDPDGDGFRNEEEHDEETDPVDDASFPFRIYAFSPTNLSFKGSVKGRLIVERCDRLGGEWTPVHVDASPRPSTSNTVDLTSTATNGFYRVRYRAK